MGIFTRPKKELSPDIFDSNQKLKSEVKSQLLHRTYTIIPEENISSLFIIGSSVGYKWEEDSDIDLNVILNDESAGADYWFDIAQNTNGWLLPGTSHPVNLFVQNYHEVSWEDAAFSVYNLLADQWSVLPPPPDSLPNPFEQNRADILTAKHHETQMYNLIKQLRRAYMNWKETHNVNWKKEIFLHLEELLEFFKEIDNDRKLAYQYGWGTPRYSAQNVIYKYLDKSNYLTLLDELEELIDGNI